MSSFASFRLGLPLAKNAWLLILCAIGSPSSWLSLVLKKLISARRWQSSLPLISASLARIVGAEIGHGVPIRFAEVCARQVLVDAFESEGKTRDPV